MVYVLLPTLKDLLTQTLLPTYSARLFLYLQSGLMVYVSSSNFSEPRIDRRYGSGRNGGFHLRVDSRRAKAIKSRFAIGLQAL
jgi:hypothetical protein